MKNQVLSIEQMKELEALGVDTSKASMYWGFQVADKKQETPILVLSDKNFLFIKKVIPTFTLHDILELLPCPIKIDTYEYWWRLSKHKIVYEEINEYPNLKYCLGDSMIESAFKMLKWIKQNNYI